MPTLHPAIEVDGANPESLQENITAAVNEIRSRAMLLGRHGIMVTQHDFNSFSVKISAEVPYGETWEQRSFR